MYSATRFNQKQLYDFSGNCTTGGNRSTVATSLDSYGNEALAEALGYLATYNPNHKFCTFAFITDIHKGHDFSYAGITAVSDQTFQLMAALNKSYEFDAVLCGGDIVNGYDSEEYYEDNASWIFAEFAQYFPDTAVCTTIGNHDKRYNDSVPLRSDAYLSNLFKGLISSSGKVVVRELDGYKTNYAVDFPAHKVRIIFVNEWGAMDQTGIQVPDGHWKRFLNIGNDADDWLVGVVSHGMFYYADVLEMVQPFLDGVSSDTYKNTNGVHGKGFIGNIVGHTHSYDSPDSYTAVVSCAYDVQSYIGTRKSVYCFAVFIVDTDRNKLVEVRVGRDAGVVEYDFVLGT